MRTFNRALTRDLGRALGRAQRRKDSAGSVLFVITTTLMLLSMMGLFALASATREVRVSGFIRQSEQAHTLSVGTMQAGSTYLDPNYAGILVHDYATGRVSSALKTTNCLSAAPLGILGITDATHLDQLASSCLRIMDTDMSANAFGGKSLEAGTGFASLTNRSGLEITYPHVQQVSGNGSNQNMHYYRATITTFGQVNSGPLSKTETGRGHIVVGPFQD